MTNPPTSIRKRVLHQLQEYRGLILFLLVMFVFRSAVADWNQVPTGSMVPSILVGDRILVNKMAYSLRIPFTLQPLAEFAPPKRGDVVTFQSPANDQLLVKRVIGIPGDTIEMQQNLLIVNGQAASYLETPTSAPIPDGQTDTGFDVTLLYESLGAESHQIALANKQPSSARHSFDPIVIPADFYWMLGDNRDFSADSRFIGMVHRRQIVGRAHAIAFSLDWEALRPRGDRFFKTLE